MYHNEYICRSKNRNNDRIFRIDSPTNILMLTTMNKKYTSMVRLQNTDLHIMNKSSIVKNIDKFFEYGVSL